MIPKVSRGHSFKRLTAYLTHDRARTGEEIPTSAERVGFVHTLNFNQDAAAGDALLAARLMAWTWQQRDALKAGAGLTGGCPSEAPPVYHLSLSWAKGEQTDEAGMMRAVGEALAAKGLGLALHKGYQTVVVQHTDTAHPHVHVMVNLVHPVTGKQANPFRDLPKLQAWARDYEKQRGTVFCHDREVKYAEIDRKRAATETRAAFTDAAKGGRPQQAGTGQPRRGDPDYQPKPDRFGRARDHVRPPRPHLPYREWKAQRAWDQVARAAADRTRAELGSKYAAMRSRHDAGYQRRQEEIRQQRDDRQVGRNAIYEKYATALDAVWKPGREEQPAPDYSRAWHTVQNVIWARQHIFDTNEQTALGRIRNALRLSEGQSIFRSVRLVLNATERRRLHERQLREAVKKHAPRQEKPRPTANTAEPRKARADRLKAMRAAELAQHDRTTAAQAAAMQARHEFQRGTEAAQKAAFKAESKAAWDQHQRDFPDQRRARASTGQAHAPKPDKQQDNSREAARTALPEGAAHAEGEAKTDRFGRSRNRKPRQPRSDRGENRQEGATGTQNRPVEAANDDRQDNGAETPEATPASSFAEQEAELTQEQWREIERQIAERDHAAIKDGGREHKI